ncbi:hypothetical protein GII33_13980 [Gordonia pseudamarae]|uniref:Uncharacterized protein n=1 Tax=Gordonia pseudamarae TaxID=2831662 RepID=A0ABX6IKY7_9ACTN|nr:MULTISPECIES: hypothetical protein [Gordonia]MBD0024446.1 hypothetical protein [Gordonia sp. (in: high G+C Gram-positive bacteria)]QHN26896.1 hypothetical protein GII33_13980 [Gordonia pseudamarae]QHN35786.1 hypothetical protein GII31_13805 [Gordonia pseudamarae]
MGRNKFASRLTQLPAVQEIRVGAQRTRALNVRVLPHRDWNTGATDPYAHLRPILFPHEGATP